MKNYIYTIGFFLAFGPGAFSQVSLSELVEQLMAPLSEVPLEEGSDWQRWETNELSWNSVLGMSDSSRNQVEMIIAIQDTLPVLGLFAGAHAERYEYLKVGEQLAAGWNITARASRGDGSVDWVEMSNAQSRFIITAQPGTAVPQFLIWLGGDGSCLILAWDTEGEVFEHILLYDLQKQYIKACAPFALNTSAMDYLFVRGEDSTWVDYTFRADAEQPVALAIHEEVPGKLSAAAWDFNQDGRMDLLGTFSSAEQQLAYRRAPGRMRIGITTEIVELRRLMAAQARKANSAWLNSQWAWMRVRPLGVELPKIKPD